jgi:alkanesulfonate monooxygenase
VSAPLRFHWRLIHGGETRGGIPPDRFGRDGALPALAMQSAFCREAEELGIDSVLINLHFATPDPIVLALALARATERLSFMVAHRPGVMSPTLFVQQVNTFSTLAPGRITLNVVAGHSPAEQLYYGDSVAHDARYERMREYLTVCERFWSGEGAVDFSGRHYRLEDGRLNTPFVSACRRSPEIYVGGGSAGARAVATEFADCWLRFADTPENVAAQAKPMLESGIEVGLRLCCVVRPTRSEALDAAEALLACKGVEQRRENETAFIKGSDAESMRRVHDLAEREWLTRCLWTGAVRVLGATAMALVGTPEEVAGEILAYEQAGISQFILHGWPKWEEMRIFCREVLPLLRKGKGGAEAAGAPKLDVQRWMPAPCGDDRG